MYFSSAELLFQLVELGLLYVISFTLFLKLEGLFGEFGHDRVFLGHHSGLFVLKVDDNFVEFRYVLMQVVSCYVHAANFCRHLFDLRVVLVA